jgi:peroxiredoxin
MLPYQAQPLDARVHQSRSGPMPTHPDKSKITAGRAFPSLQLSGLDGTAVAIPDAGETIHLQLRRFAGCPVCNLHLRSFVRRADEITTAGIREIVVFHSTPESLRVYQPDLPFTIIADPTKQIYRALGVERTARALLDPRLLIRLPKIFLGAIRGIVRPPHRIPPMLPTGSARRSGRLPHRQRRARHRGEVRPTRLRPMDRR